MRDSCLAYVVFKPTQVGEQAASLQVKDTSSDITVVKNYAETGIAVASELRLNLNPLDIGVVDLNTPGFNSLNLNSQDTFTVGPATGGNASVIFPHPSPPPAALEVAGRIRVVAPSR